MGCFKGMGLDKLIQQRQKVMASEPQFWQTVVAAQRVGRALHTPHRRVCKSEYPSTPTAGNRQRVFSWVHFTKKTAQNAP